MIVQNLPEWHKEVCERDKYICQLQTAPECKKDYNFEYYFDEKGVNQYVCGDHLATQGSSPEFRFETKNGKCVCRPCHALRHKGIVPEGYLTPYEEETPLKREMQEPKFLQIDKTSISHSTRIKGWENLCKCGKYITIETTGTCMRCEKYQGTSFKEKSKKKSSNK